MVVVVVVVDSGAGLGEAVMVARAGAGEEVVLSCAIVSDAWLSERIRGKE